MAKNKLRKVHKNELATYARSSHLFAYPSYGGERVQFKDENLINNGSYLAYEVYRDLLRDPHTYAVCQKRWLAVVGREWDLIPASDRRVDKKATEMVRAHLEALGSHSEMREGLDVIPNLNTGFDQVCYNLLRGEFYGFRPAEIIWDADGKESYPRMVKDKSSGRFVYLVGEKGFLFRLLTNDHPTYGVPLPARKFIIHTWQPEDDNPYGWGLGARVFYPVLWKRELARFALIFADKYGSPTGKITYPQSLKHLLDEIQERIDNQAQEANVYIPEGIDFEWLVSNSQGTDLYIGLMDYFDREISKAVLGETGSTDQQGAGGSRARDQVGNEIRIEIAKASADLLCATLNNTLIKWDVWHNFGDKAKPPKLVRKFPELEEKEDLNGRASRDRTLSEMMGLKPTKEYIETTYGIEFAEPEVEGNISSELAAIFGNNGQSPQQETPPPGNNQDLEAEFSSYLLEFATKKVIDWNGLQIGVEYLDGDRRHGKKLAGSYGHIRNHVGEDGEALDAYLAPGVVDGNRGSDRVYRVTQFNEEGEFDEFKFMLGYKSKKAAREAYQAAISKKNFGGIRESSIEDIRQYDKKIIRNRVDSLTDEAINLSLPTVDAMMRKIRTEAGKVNKLPTSDEAKFSQLKESLIAFYDNLDSSTYAENLATALAASELAGQYEVRLENNGNKTS